MNVDPNLICLTNEYEILYNNNILSTVKVGFGLSRTAVLHMNTNTRCIRIYSSSKVDCIVVGFEQDFDQVG